MPTLITHTEKLSTGIYRCPSTNPGQCHVLSIRMKAGCSLPECRKGWMIILTTDERGPWPEKQLSSLIAVWRRPGILDVMGGRKTWHTASTRQGTVLTLWIYACTRYQVGSGLTRAPASESIADLISSVDPSCSELLSKFHWLLKLLRQ